MESLNQLWSQWSSEAQFSGELQTMDWAQFATSLAASIVMGLMLNALYNLYFRDNEPQDGSLSRSLILLTPALTAIFWMIQSSVTLSLGLLGSMSFVRFRTPVKRSEDVTFIVLALASAISCATRSFPIAMALVSIFFIFVLFRNNFLIWTQKRRQLAVVTFNTKTKNSGNTLLERLKKEKVSAELVSTRSYDGIQSYVINTTLTGDQSQELLLKICNEIDDDAKTNIFFPSERLGAG